MSDSDWSVFAQNVTAFWRDVAATTMDTAARNTISLLLWNVGNAKDAASREHVVREFHALVRSYRERQKQLRRKKSVKAAASAAGKGGISNNHNSGSTTSGHGNAERLSGRKRSKSRDDEDRDYEVDEDDDDDDDEDDGARDDDDDDLWESSKHHSHRRTSNTNNNNHHGGGSNSSSSRKRTSSNGSAISVAATVKKSSVTHSTTSLSTVTGSSDLGAFGSDGSAILPATTIGGGAEVPDEAAVEASKIKAQSIAAQTGLNFEAVCGALAEPVRVSCVSFQGNFHAVGPMRLDLDHVAGFFAPVDGKYPSMTVALNYGEGCESGGITSTELQVAEVATLRKNKTTSNFIVFKFVLANLKLSLKLYSSRYFQLFGASDRPGLSAQEACMAVIRFVAERARASREPVLGGLSSMSVMGMSAHHSGLSEHRFGLDLEALRVALLSEGETLSSNSRTGALVLKSQGSRGSWFFHAKGTVQLYGTKLTAAEGSRTLTAMMYRNLHVIRPGNGGSLHSEAGLSSAAAAAAPAPAKRSRTSSGGSNSRSTKARSSSAPSSSTPAAAAASSSSSMQMTAMPGVPGSVVHCNPASYDDPAVATASSHMAVAPMPSMSFFSSMRVLRSGSLNSLRSV